MGTVKNPTTTDDELRRAIEAGRNRRATERRAASVHYDPGRDAIEIELTDGAGVRLPKAMVEEFRDVPPADMAKLRVSSAGDGIRLDEHDVNISVHGLIGALHRRHGGITGEDRWRGGDGGEARQRAGKRREGRAPRKIPQVA